MPSQVSFESILETDYDGFLKFCQSLHAEESVKFWNDVETFRKRALHVQSLPQPSLAPSRADLKSQETTSPTQKTTSGQRVSRRLSQTNSYLNSWSKLTLKETSPSKPFLSRLSDMSPATASFRLSKRNFKLADNDINCGDNGKSNDSMESTNPLASNVAAVPALVLKGSSVMKIELSMAKNLSNKLGIQTEELELLDLAQAMFITYFDVNSPTQICMKPDVVDRLELEVESGKCHVDMFDEAQQIVFYEMSVDLFPQYLQKVYLPFLMKIPPPPPILSNDGEEKLAN